MNKHFLALFFLCFNIHYSSFSQCIISGKIVDNNSHGIGKVQINIRTDEERIQKYSQLDGSFKFESKKLKYDDLVTLYISAKNLEPLDQRDLTFQIQKNKLIEIPLVPIGLKNKIENEFIVSIHQESMESKKRLNQLLQNRDLSLNKKKLVEDSIKKNKINDSLIIKSSSLYAKSVLRKNSNTIQQSFNLIKEGKTDEAKKTLLEDDDAIEEKQIQSKIEEWYDKAELFQSLLEYKKANEFYKRVLTFNSTNINYITGYVDFLIFSNNKSQEALEILNKINVNQIQDDSIKVDVFNMYGAAHADMGKKDTAFFYYTKQIEIAKRSGTLSKVNKILTIGRAYNNIGNLYSNTSDSLGVAYYEKGIEYLNSALNEKVIDTFSIFITTNYNLGIKYFSRGNIKLAKSFFLNAQNSLNARKRRTAFEINYYFEINEELAKIKFKLNKSLQAIDSNNIILDSLILLNNIYNDNLSVNLKDFYSIQAANYANIGYYKNSFKFYQKSLEYQRRYYNDTSIQYNNEVADIFLNLGFEMNNLNFPDSAKLYYDSAKMYYLKSNTLIDFQLDNETKEYFDYKFYNYTNIANWYRLKNDQVKRLQNFDNAESLLDKANLNDSLKLQYRVYINNAFADYYRSIGQYTNAYSKRIENINIYIKIKNNFINDLKIADLAKDAADDIYEYAQSNDSIQLYKTSISLFLKSLFTYNKFYQLDSIYISDLAYLKYSIGLAYKEISNDSLSKEFLIGAINDYPLCDLSDATYDILGQINFSLGKITKDNFKKIKYYKEALRYVDTLHKHNPSNEKYRYAKASTLNNIGVAFGDLKLNDTAVKFYNLSLEEIGEIYDKNKQCLSCWIASRENIADYFKISNDFKKELKIRVEDAFFLETEIKFDSLYKYFDSSSAQSLYRIYIRCASVFKNENQYDSAINSAQKAIYIVNKFDLRDSTTISRLNECYNDLSFYQILDKQPSLAVINIKKAISYSSFVDTLDREGNYVNLIFAYIFNNNFSKAKKTYTNFISEMPNKSDNFKNLVQDEMVDYEKRNITHSDFNKLKEYINK